mgnify:CR=1 FL=1
MGMAHKLHAYATAVGLSLTDDSVLLQFGAVSLGVVEFILGIYLLIGVHRRLTTIVTALFMLIFTAMAMPSHSLTDRHWLKTLYCFPQQFICHVIHKKSAGLFQLATTGSYPFTRGYMP